MTVERGIDPREYALMAFGGAGPLHACALAQELGIRRVVCPRASGVLCALGLAAAAPRRDASRTVMLRGSAFTRDALARLREELLAQARSTATAESGEDILDGTVRACEAAASGPSSTAQSGEDILDGNARAHTRAHAHAHFDARGRTIYELRYRGQSHELPVESDSVDPAVLREEFARAHEQRYGYRDDAGELELVSIRASVWGAAPALSLRGDGGGERIEGPAVHPLPEATLYVPAGWSGEVDEWGTAHLQGAPA
jgi:N-methylhydantoinase A/oxoprolinase/acetone carboxylase beta subunit